MFIIICEEGWILINIELDMREETRRGRRREE
jgi:hypothetical protein